MRSLLSYARPAAVAAVCVSLVASSVLSLAPAAWAGAEQGGGSAGGGAEEADTGSGGGLSCRNGQLYVGSKKWSYDPWPGCTGDSFNRYDSDETRYCEAGYMVFRFFGTASDPAQGMTVSRVNTPIYELPCWQKLNPEYDYKAFATRGSFIMTPTSPADAGVTNRGRLRDWAAYAEKSSVLLKEAYMNAADTRYDSKASTQVWRVPSPDFPSKFPGDNAGLPTSGLPFDFENESCTVFSAPAAHQITTGPDAFGTNRAYATAVRAPDGTLLLNYDGNGNDKEEFNTNTYFGALNQWARDFTQSRRGSNNATNDDYQSRLLGLSNGNTVLSEQTLASAQYVECGSPLNYQHFFTADDVLEYDENGLPVKLRAPNPADFKVNAVGYVFLARSTNIFYSIGSCNGDKDCIEAIKKQKVGLPALRAFGSYSNGEAKYEQYLAPGYNAFNRVCVASLSDSRFARECGSDTIRQLFGSSANMNASIENKLRTALKKWYRANDDNSANVPSTNNKMVGLDSNRDLAVVGYDPTYLADNTSLFIMDSFYSLDAALMPSTDELPEPDPRPVVPESDDPEPTPDVPTPPTPVTPDAQGFTWQIEADTKPYLEVRADNSSVNTFPFRARLVSAWKSPQEMKRYIDNIGQSRMDADFANAEAAWRQVESRVTSQGAAGKLASATFGGSKRADFTNVVWEPSISYEGLATQTFVPQCNTGQDPRSCPPQGTNWNAAPATNPECDSPGCFTEEQVVNNQRRNGTGIGPSGSGLRLATNYEPGMSRVQLGAWSFDFFAATAQGKSVTLARTDTRPADVDVTFNASAATRANTSWFVTGSYVPWKEIREDREFSVECPLMRYTPRQFDEETGDELFYRPTGCTEWRSVFVRWDRDSAQRFSRGGDYTQYQVPDNLSAVIADENGRVISGGTGGANCAAPAPAAWNYCSPVLAGKIS